MLSEDEIIEIGARALGDAVDGRGGELLPSWRTAMYRSEAKRIVRALRAAGLVLEQGWRFDMENAPRDGTKIIVYRPKFDGNYIPQVGMDYWMDGKCWGKSRPDTPPIAWRPFPTPPTDSKGGA